MYAHQEDYYKVLLATQLDRIIHQRHPIDNHLQGFMMMKSLPIVVVDVGEAVVLAVLGNVE
jgi:hypothetical protein